MARPAAAIIAAIEDFRPSAGNWLGLDELVDELFESGSASQGVKALLGVFERYPTEDGAGVCWTIVHGLETLTGYENHLIESVRKAPSDFGMVMVHRLLKAGYEAVDGVRLLPLLEQIARNENTKPDIRRSAQKYLGWHKG
jgi:hypothetical protein